MNYSPPPSGEGLVEVLALLFGFVGLLVFGAFAAVALG